MDQRQVRTTTVKPLPPPVLTSDVYEDAGGDAYIIDIPVPGLTSEEILIEVTSGTLTVSTKPRQDGPETERKYIQREQPVQPTSRVFEFPMEIDPDHVTATLENGILKVRVPKAAAAPRRIIRIGQSS